MKFLLSALFLLFSNLALATTTPVNIIDPYVRAIAPGLTVSAAFMTLQNKSDTDIALVKIEGTIAKHIELHQHIHKDGMMQMRQVKKIAISANTSVELKPGGYHIMLIGLTKKIKQDDEIELQLVFSDDSKQRVKTKVMSIEQVMEKQKEKEKSLTK